MGCAGSTGGSTYPGDQRHSGYNNQEYTGRTTDNNGFKTNNTNNTDNTGNQTTDNTGHHTTDNTGHQTTDNTGNQTTDNTGNQKMMGAGGYMVSFGRESTPEPRDPTPPPPREPTPPPPREPTPPPPREPTPPPPREPTPPPPREPTPPPVIKTEERKPAPGGGTRGNYTENYGIYECNPYEFRSQPEDLDRVFSDEPTQLPYTDKEFGASQAIEGERVEWKRPGEFRDNPVLISDGTTRYDIGQGSAGTCWFLSMVAMLADRPELFHRVVPKDAWNQEGGYFYCYFWRYGEWEKVYIDDYLPIVHGTELWGAKSSEDREEMWPAFLEKAFARFHGNYNAVYGGQSGDAFLALTGGCSEYIDFDDALEADCNGDTMLKAKEVHRRMKNACRQGDCMLTTEVPAKYDGHCGLVGGHAYSLTDATTVKLKNGKVQHLVRIRNPWGHTEWKGPWSDGSSEWNNLAPGEDLQCPNKDDGEFWMTLKDFITYFSSITVCSLVPDFDKDGASDTLKLHFCTTMMGDWFGKNAAGFNDRINNPRYVFHLDDEGMDEDGKVPVVIQICQKLKHRKKNKASVRVDLYKVLGERTDGSKMAVMALLGDVTNVYKMERQMSGRYKVEPGYYAVVPSTMNPGIEKEFLVRVYSPSPLQDVRELDRSYKMMESEEFKAPEGTVIRYNETIFGAWKTGFNAGGQVSNRNTFYKNPQVEFVIPSRGGSELVNFTLMQESGSENFPIGLRLFTMDDGYEIQDDPAHLNYLYDNYESCPKSIEGQDGAFVMGSSADVTYQLPAGRYFILLHADTTSQEKNFSLIIRSSCSLQPKLFNVQP